MPEYISAVEAAAKWGISKRRVTLLCSEARIPGASLVGQQWIIPIDAEKPPDARLKSTSILRKSKRGEEKHDE